MHIDYARAREVFAIMLALYRARLHPYDNLENDLPQGKIPEQIKRDPLVHSRFLFLACLYMRGTVISSQAFTILVQLWRDYPWLFDPEHVLKSNSWEIGLILREQIPWRFDQIGRFWYENMLILREDWGGDPRNLFADTSDKQELYARFMGHHGYRKMRGHKWKMTSMQSYFQVEAKLVPPNELSAPVDFHHLRVYLSSQMLTLPHGSREVRYEKVERLGIELAEWLQAEFSLPAVCFGDIIWVWSLRLCSRAPLTKCRKLPGSKPEKRTPVEVDWREPAFVRMHDRSCGACAIASHCEFAVPAGVYYTQGVFMLRERSNPPRHSIFEVLPLQRRDDGGDSHQQRALRRHERRLRARAKEPAPSLRPSEQLSLLEE